MNRDNENANNIPIKLVGFGYSHIISILFSSYILESYGNISIDTILLSNPDIPPIFLSDTIDDYQFSMEFGNYVNDVSAGSDVIFLCLAGNAHHIFSLVNHPIPFDFVLEDEPNLPLHPDYEIVPSQLVIEALINQGGYPNSIRALRAFRRFLPDKQLFQCSLPPINPSADHIKKYPEVFHDKIEQLGVTPELIRYKHWRLHSKLIYTECANLGIKYIQPPNSMVDENGFLVPEAWNLDATHANPYYGTKVIEQLVQIKIPSFSLTEPK